MCSRQLCLLKVGFDVPGPAVMPWNVLITPGAFSALRRRSILTPWCVPGLGYPTMPTRQIDKWAVLPDASAKVARDKGTQSMRAHVVANLMVAE